MQSSPGSVLKYKPTRSQIRQSAALLLRIARCLNNKFNDYISCYSLQ